MDLLNEYGCDEAQGYYFSRPLPGEDLLEWLETSSFGVPRRLDTAGAGRDRPLRSARPSAASS